MDAYSILISHTKEGGMCIMKKGWLRHLDFIMVDIASIVLALILTHFSNEFLLHKDTDILRQLFFMLPLINLFSSIMLDSYNGILQRGYLKEFQALLNLDFFVASILLLLLYLTKLLYSMPRSIMILYFLFQFPLTYVLRFVHKFYLRKHYNSIKNSRQIVVATTADAGDKMIQTLTQSAIRNYHFFGLAILDRHMTGEMIGQVPVSADRDSFIDYVKKHVVDEVFINLPDNPNDTLELTRELLDMGITVHIYMENAYQALPNRCISNVFGYNVLTTTISPISFRQTLLKRSFDILGGITGCILTILIGLVIGPIIYIKSPGPILFSQIRVGKKGRPFRIYKFRSMYMDAEEKKKELMQQNKMKDNFMFKIDNDPRIIKGIGSFIRKTSLDEFPQFWNVLKGDMSMVGTRPPTLDEYQQYSPHHKRRLSMLPGITGLWQISGRSNITDFEEVVRLDTEYIENWSVDLDIKIILKTILRIFKKEGAF